MGMNNCGFDVQKYVEKFNYVEDVDKEYLRKILQGQDKRISFLSIDLYSPVMSEYHSLMLRSEVESPDIFETTYTNGSVGFLICKPESRPYHYGVVLADIPMDSIVSVIYKKYQNNMVGFVIINEQGYYYHMVFTLK